MQQCSILAWLALFACLASAALGASPVVSNVTAVQRAGTKLVDISYDVTADTPTVIVYLEISSNGGTTFNVPAATISGSVGERVAVGAGRTITWDAGPDWSGQYSTQMRFRVAAYDSLPVGFSFIPAGPFTMGDPLDGIVDAPPRAISLSAFHIGQKEVSKSEWDTVRAWAVSHGYSDLAIGTGKATNHPVQTISWWEAVKWCNARSEKEGLTPCYTVNGAAMQVGAANPTVRWSANGYRLPTEAEWEKAARGGLSGKRFPWGDTISHTRSNFYNTGSETYETGTTGMHPTYRTGGYPFTAPVGSFAPNGYGLYDMAGNVWEHCWDWYGSDYYGVAAMVNPLGPDSGIRRVLRGAGWGSGPTGCRVASRGDPWPSGPDIYIGFRVVRSSITPGGGSALSGDAVTDTCERFVLSAKSPYGDTTGAGAFLPGSTVQLVVTVDPGYVFTGWTGDATGADNPLTVLMDSDKTITANFIPDVFDADGDGLSAFDEVISYGSNPSLPDTDGDGLSDGKEAGAGRFSVIAGAFTWQQARADAHERGGELACFPSKVRWNKVMELLGADALDGYTGLWIGASDAVVDGSWTWVNGEAFDFNQWASGKPGTADGNTLDFAEVSGGDSSGEIGKWYDRSSTSIRDGYILEIGYSTDPTRGDTDGDALSDSIEQTSGLNPIKADTDGDGLADGQEVNVAHTDPLRPDSDGDELTDGQEVSLFHTNPLLADTDGDTFLDGAEVEFGGNPLSAAMVPKFLARALAGPTAGLIQLRFLSQQGRTYALYASGNLASWTQLEADIAGTGGTISRLYPIKDQPMRQFRVMRN